MPSGSVRAEPGLPTALSPSKGAPGGPRALQQTCACPSTGPRTAPCEHCRRQALLGTLPGLQAFRVGAPDDAFEQEAERLATQALAGGRRGAITPLPPRAAQRAPVPECATKPGTQGRIKTGPLARWDWVRHRDSIKLGNRVVEKGALTIGAWPWMTNNPGDITVSLAQEGSKKHTLQNHAFRHGAMPGRAVSTGHVPLAVFDTLEQGFAALQAWLLLPEFQPLTLREAVDRHLGGAANPNRVAGVDDTDPAVVRIVKRLRDLGIPATPQTRLSQLKGDTAIVAAAKAFGFAEGVENVGLTYRCTGRDKRDDERIPATVWKVHLGMVKDETPPEVAQLLCCDLPPAQRAAEPGAAPGAQAATEVHAPPFEGPGQPLPATLRQDMQARLGHDFSQVRVHADATAHRQAHALHAAAYTWGQHIVFAQGRFAPTSHAGRHLLAHELVHVVQQRGGAAAQVQREFALEPKAFDPTERTMTEEDIRAALAFNQAQLKNTRQLARLRDVLALKPEPAVADRDFALAVARFQAQHGVAQDGQLGRVTMLLMVEEFQAANLAAGAEQLKGLFARGTFMDIDTSHCACKPRLEAELKTADHFIAEYTACGADPAVANGPAVEVCIQDRARAAGRTLTTLGTTSASVAINVTGARGGGACKALMERIDLAHEQIHAEHEVELDQAHGKRSAARNTARNDKADWVANEVLSRNTDKSLATWALAVLERICP
jgi:hypothetical protein